MNLLLPKVTQLLLILLLTLAPRNNMVEIFSAFSNVKKLLAVRTQKHPLDCLNGIRVLSMFYVVIGHTYVMSMFFPLINALSILDVSINMIKYLP